MSNNVKIFILVIVLLILGTAATILLQSESVPAGPGKYDKFAICLKDQGAVFYGAFWCPHCQTQKKLFGTSQKLLPYVECSPVSGQGQTQECMDKKIESYPTWEFADGTRLNGEIPLAQLAEKTSCALPQ
ncbi:TPA: hypothetical protein DEQ22_00965 [Candidatus Nomurabacteria bacterium]|uniref:Thioredoxin domain-containing protein n=1 Tax=Candidatus Nomurabacteria bacterium RIFOXYA2_FULL_42_12 TaxID=1801801 RepID=A0A1F6YLK3_9BACT|nr:MAG: hypothetical protein UV13_C0002G0036 [Parcubacteria group bacterium GW2011_GWC1_42_21]KKS56714.1 MAG: hypothetical protein UV23_C0036G0010 [Candidatus Nomurabacteria bacterium GW2011_GWF1_42_40]KKT00377.1 MAG: hypothetical protein UV77_C0004G0009 [Candidatus Nomurabacteria bacterium GW2011_GWA1_43_17]KKT17910.1 MAG: hypothetical protein UW01_C0007G0008 [Candidatus Nomurabacteria bacterium GW2011_GWA2_43_66]OGJ04862.1 MAG: hypothetical protein A2357_00760 [Candidatus Nomurabacteria bacte